MPPGHRTLDTEHWTLDTGQGLLQKTQSSDPTDLERTANLELAISFVSQARWSVLLVCWSVGSPVGLVWISNRRNCQTTNSGLSSTGSCSWRRNRLCSSK